MNSQVEQERAAIGKAIKATEYKYFGYYEFSDDQREAVDTLVAVAQARLASLASQPPVLDEREGATLSPDPVLLGEVRQALERIRMAGLNVLAAMDDCNAANGTYIGGGAFFEMARAIHQADKALAHLRSGDPQ